MSATWYTVGLSFGLCFQSVGPKPMLKRTTRIAELPGGKVVPRLVDDHQQRQPEDGDEVARDRHLLITLRRLGPPRHWARPYG